LYLKNEDVDICVQMSTSASVDTISKTLEFFSTIVDLYSRIQKLSSTLVDYYFMI